MNIYVSFDYENDKHYKFLLEAWNANPNFAFNFSDRSSHEINSNNVDRIKAGLTSKIKESTHLLVVIGKEANTKHPDSDLIGDINWINWEINKAKELGKELIAIKINSRYISPDAIRNCGASWAMCFRTEPIMKALINCGSG